MPPAVPETQASSEPTWFYAHNRQKLGPVPLQDLRELAAAGRLQPTDMVLQTGAQKWCAAQEIPGLFASRLESFLADLKTAHASIQNPINLLHDLSRQFDERRRLIHTRRSHFLTDLRSVHEGIAVIDPAVYIPDLVHRFDRCRSQALSTITDFLAAVPADDPIRCPISLFETMKHGRLETAHTRVLAWLLDPTQPHGFGATLLEALWEQIADAPLRGRPCIERVEAEKRIWLEDKRTGRIDLCVQGHFPDVADALPWFLFIEAKIDAREGDRQLAKYDWWLNANVIGRDLVRVFLTPEGLAPSHDAWQPLSFIQLASAFRSRFPTLKDAPGYHYLRFYLTALMKDVCRWALPLVDAQTCSDPYGVLEYLRAVKGRNGKEES